MCVDFTNLNKAYAQDPFPLPRIDQIVDSTAECDLLCFLDAFSGYHQIKCVFGVPSGKLLGFLVSHRGIEANPEKIKAIEDMSPPQTLKEMQKLGERAIEREPEQLQQREHYKKNTLP